MDCLELYWTDVYKTGHKPMLPTGSSLMSSNLTPRSGKHANFPNSTGVMSFGQQMTMRKMKEDWDKNFFNRDISEIDQFGKDMTDMLMLKEPFDVSHFKELHKLGYLPLKVKAIEEGNHIPYKVPLLTIVNTSPLNGVIVDWLVNYLETILSAESWQAPTSATLGYRYKKLGKEWLLKTDPDNMWFLDYQFHDFSMRGMGGKSSIVNSSMGFASCTRGSDTLPIIPLSRKFYDEVGVSINSVIATEHAIMCALTGFYLMTKDGTWEKIGELEVETFRHLLKLFPTGIISIVSDTWDLWRVIMDYCKILKDDILARDGKMVIRPDSGFPPDIVCGLNSRGGCWLREEDNKFYYTSDKGFLGDMKQYEVGEGEYKGVIELLWEIFGGTTNDNGYKVLDSHVGAIYGDAISYDRAEQIFIRLAKKKFATSNIVLGVGSYSLQYVTRDTHGMAQKATYIEINGVGIEIFKDPITDSGIKKSARGLLRVDLIDGEYVLKDQCTWQEESGGELQIIFEDGKFFNQTTLTEIRERVNARLEKETMVA